MNKLEYSRRNGTQKIRITSKYFKSLPGKDKHGLEMLGGFFLKVWHNSGPFCCHPV